MKKPKIFIACDTTSIKKINKIFRETEKTKKNFGYKFGLEFLNSKNGRKFILKHKTKLLLETISLPIYQILVLQQ